MVEYPSVDKVIEFNLLALNIMKAKKADSATVLSRAKISGVIGNCRELQGDLYDKAVVLLKGLIQSHPFASGNRRTAFIAMKYFLAMNSQRIGVKDEPGNVRVLLGIRGNYYSDSEIKEWVKNGEIKKFER